MIIDAMDLLYTRRFDGFCLVSSDGDFTKLASRGQRGERRTGARVADRSGYPPMLGAST
jgi:uncharacterized LabA/DUF88 family protein